MNKIGKSFFVVFLVAALLMIIKGITAYAYIGSIFQYTYEGKTITYQVLSEPTETENGTARVIYSGEVDKNLKGEVVIPSAVTNQRMLYQVVKIENSAFMDAEGITTIVLPDTVMAIGEDAFRNCNALTNINIPRGVKRIEKGTFYGCSSLGSIYLPEGTTYIGDKAFYNNSKLKNINLVKEINYLGEGAFEGCSSLISISIPEGITVIEDNLFENCFNLTYISIPEGIKRIGEDAFYNCKSLISIHIPDEVTSIGSYAFYSCESLTSIKIPFGVTKIETSTFLLCSNLTQIRIPDKVTSIGDFAFYYCSNLISIELPEGLTSIGKLAFYGCSNLRPVTIPKSVTSIGFGEFPYTGVFVYKNSYAEDFFKENYPKYYQIVKIPLEEMSFNENIVNIGTGDRISLNPIFYPINSTDITDNRSWSSSNPSVVAVNADGTATGLQAGEADVTVTMGKYSATCHLIVGGIAIHPTSIEFVSNNIRMKKGETLRLPLTFTPAEATNRRITWTSSDPSVVTVDNGRIYARNSGSAEITATSTEASAKCKVTVYQPLKEIYSDYDHITLNKGDTKKIAVSYYPTDTTENTTTFWQSDNIAVATVENGIIKAVNPGSTFITATIGRFTHTIPITVQIPVKSLSLSQKEITLTAGQKLSLPLVVIPADTTDKLIVTSSDETVASYSAGTITALKRGTTTITAKCGGFIVACQITVKTDIESIALNKNTLNLYFGNSEVLNVIFSPTEVKDDKTIIWESSDQSVITIDSAGKVKTVGVGNATITATAGGNKTASCSVTVKLSIPTAIKAASGGYDRVKLSWGAVSGASGYRIYRADTKTGSYVLIKDTTSNTYTNTGLTTGKTYYYKVRGYRYQGTKKVYSSYSPILGAVPIPSTPDHVKLVKPKAGSVNFTWNKVSGASGYEIYRTSSTKEPFKLTKSTTSLHFINYGLTKGRTYSFKVRAYKIIGKKKVYSNFSTVFSMKM